MAKKFTWKVLLVINRLLPDNDNEYIAEVSSNGKTLRNEDIARIIKEEGSELHYETILDILNRADRHIIKYILMGYSMQTGLTHIAPRVTGNWLGSTEPFDPAKHKITCDCSITDELRKALEEVNVEVIGVKDNGARIGLLIDVESGKTDGTVTPNGNLIIEGKKIRIAPVEEDNLGIFFVSADGTEIPVTSPLVQNNPSRVVCRAPMLAPGKYTLKIVTQFSSSTTALKAPRTIVYGMTIKVS
jgi:hypothetical protein